MTPTEVLLLALSSLGLTLAAGYACWVKVRVLRLRADILKIHVQLYQTARALNGLGDPAYVNMTSLINFLIRWSDSFSVEMFLYIARWAPEGDKFPKFSASTPELQKALERAYLALVVRLVNYISRETLGGLFFWYVLLMDLPSKETRYEAKQEGLSFMRALGSVLVASQLPSFITC